MDIMLGNINTEELETRLGIELTTEDRSSLKSCWQASATVKPGGWHCFDIPFVLVCGDMKTGEKINKILSPYSSKMKKSLTISVWRKKK